MGLGGVSWWLSVCVIWLDMATPPWWREKMVYYYQVLLQTGKSLVYFVRTQLVQLGYSPVSEVYHLLSQIKVEEYFQMERSVVSGATTADSCCTPLSSWISRSQVLADPMLAESSVGTCADSVVMTCSSQCVTSLLGIHGSPGLLRSDSDSTQERGSVLATNTWHIFETRWNLDGLTPWSSSISWETR